MSAGVASGSCAGAAELRQVPAAHCTSTIKSIFPALQVCTIPHPPGRKTPTGSKLFMPTCLQKQQQHDMQWDSHCSNAKQANTLLLPIGRFWGAAMVAATETDYKHRCSQPLQPQQSPTEQTKGQAATVQIVSAMFNGANNDANHGLYVY